MSTATKIEADVAELVVERIATKRSVNDVVRAMAEERALVVLAGAHWTARRDTPDPLS